MSFPSLTNLIFLFALIIQVAVWVFTQHFVCFNLGGWILLLFKNYAPNEWSSNTLPCGLGLIPSSCKVRVSSSPVIPMDEQTTRWYGSRYHYVCWIFMFIFSWGRFGSNKNVRESISVQRTSKPLPVFDCDTVLSEQQIKGSMFAGGIVLMSKPSFQCSCKHLPELSLKIAVHVCFAALQRPGRA